MKRKDRDIQAQAILEKTITDLQKLLKITKLNSAKDEKNTTADLIYGCLCCINGLAYTNDDNLRTALCLLSDLLGNILAENH